MIMFIVHVDWLSTNTIFRKGSMEKISYEKGLPGRRLSMEAIRKYIDASRLMDVTAFFPYSLFGKVFPLLNLTILQSEF